MAQRTRIKICGITRLEDALAAVKAGADALGFVFYPASPRFISPQSAGEIIRQLPAFVQTVGLFVNATVGEVTTAVEQSGVQLLQFHGDEEAPACARLAASLRLPYIKAVAVQPGDDLSAAIVPHIQAGARAILLDTFDPRLYGGTGRAFDWTSWPEIDIPLVLAGGLTPLIVRQGIAATRPYAVDVSGGVEAEDPATGKPIKGIKDAEKIQAFIQAVQETDFESARQF